MLPVNSWMGQGSKIANEHYLQVTEADWQAAESFTDQIGGDTGGDISAAQSPPTTGAIYAADGCGGQVNIQTVPPPRFERGFPD